MDANARYIVFLYTKEKKRVFPFIRTTGKDKSPFVNYIL